MYGGVAYGGVAYGGIAYGGVAYISTLLGNGNILDVCVFLVDGSLNLQH